MPHPKKHLLYKIHDKTVMDLHQPKFTIWQNVHNHPYILHAYFCPPIDRLIEKLTPKSQLISREALKAFNYSV
jgi:hypothetical protein